MMSCASQVPEKSGGEFSATQLETTVGGQPVISLSRPSSEDKSHPQILSAEILPGRGMNIYQLKVFVPGQGVVDMFASPSLDEAKKMMNGGPDDLYGNPSFRVGGAILVPYANRIRGKLLPDEKWLETTIYGKTVKLPANFQSGVPTAEKHSLHGLILATPMDEIKTEAGENQAGVTATLDAGDFRGHWLSKTHLTFTATLKNDGFGFSVVAKNTGDEALPMGIGWHPYFVFPSGNREQAKLYVSARKRAQVNNYDDIFPTGKLIPIQGTDYDFSVPGGAPLKKMFLDDCFVDLVKDAQGQTVTEIVDPAAQYGVRMISPSPEVTAVQTYSPVEKNFVAVEPQFNWADPFSKVWDKSVDTGMVILQPGESVTYEIQLEVFVP